MNDSIKKRIEDIKRMPASEIAQVPEYSDEQVVSKGKKFTLAIWKERQEDGGIQIVIQAYYHKFLGIGIMMADGFVMDKTGSFLPLPEKKRLEYC